MVDLADKQQQQQQRSDSEEMNNSCSDVPLTAAASDSASSEESQVNEAKKTCADCGTSKTPLWRGGPAGPKSLCNACGIRSRKKRRAILGYKDEKKPKKSSNQSSNSSATNNNNSNNKRSSKFGSTLNERLLAALGREVLMQRSGMDKRRKLGEEEQAAVLLMALSYGSAVYA